MITFNLISYSLLVACLTKSAQLPYSGWLTDAMAAPTPVSGLLHAATMVTAGIFILLRVCNLLSYSYYLSYILTSVGASTILLAGVLAIYQSDNKRIVAYSTTSQLGYMCSSCGLSNYSGAMFHLFSHAFFKALVFLAAGVVIHSIGNSQNVITIIRNFIRT